MNDATRREAAQLFAAMIAHEANRVYSLSIGDTSHPHWEAAPEWQRQSSLNGVARVIAGDTPEQLHESWLQEKRETGWKYGPVKNSKTKEHPCFVPYADLPPEQRTKDQLYLSVVRAMLAALEV